MLKLISHLSYGQKLDRYISGEWFCPVPPVPCAGWEKEDWIKFIDMHGGWT